MARDESVDKEEEYFHRIDQEKLSQIKADQADVDASEEAKRRRSIHFHKCGKCGSDMDTQLFKGVEIERCPNCSAVLLDPGELEDLAGEDKSGGFLSALLGLNKD